MTQPYTHGRRRSLTKRVLLACTALVATAAAATETITYTYDARGRLTKVEHAGSINDGLTAAYTYDKAENRTNVTVTIANGIAAASSDYTATSDPVPLGDSETSETATAVTLQDTLLEDDETINVNLSGAMGASSSEAQGVGTIIDDDTLTLCGPSADPTIDSPDESSSESSTTGPPNASRTEPDTTQMLPPTC